MISRSERGTSTDEASQTLGKVDARDRDREECIDRKTTLSYKAVACPCMRANNTETESEAETGIHVQGKNRQERKRKRNERAWYRKEPGDSEAIVHVQWTLERS